MPLKYKLQTRNYNLRGVTKPLTVARGVYFAETNVEHMCTLIEQISAVSEGDVRSVLNTLSKLVAMELKAGRIVSLGDLGRFRLSPRCKAAESEEAFGKDNLLKPRLLFVPGRALVEARKETAYRLIRLGETADDGEGGKPDTGEDNGGTGGGTPDSPVTPDNPPAGGETDPFAPHN